MPLEFREEASRLEAEYAGVPEVPSGLEVLRRGCGVGLFAEAEDGLAFVLYIPVARLRVLRLDAEGDELSPLGKFAGAANCGAVGVRFGDEVVGRTYEEDFLRVHAQGDEGNSRRGVAPDGLHEPAPSGKPRPCKFRKREECLLRVHRDGEGVRKPPVALNSPAEQRARLEQGIKLLRQLLPRNRPEPRPGPAAKDERGHIHSLVIRFSSMD